MSEPVLTDADVAYIQANYVTLGDLCAGRPETPGAVRALIRAGALPMPSYVLDDGTEMFPAEYFLLADQAGGVERLKPYFEERHRAAGGDPGNLSEDCQGYLSGLYGVCLRHAVPEAMVRKTQLVESPEELLAGPDPQSAEWGARIRREVCELDQLERPFSPDYDRGERFPSPPTRDRLIVAAREQYPDLFAAEVSVA